MSEEAWEAAALLAHTEASAGAPLGGSTVAIDSPRKGRRSVTEAARRPKQAVVAELDPEGDERRRQMELLRQRMNELPHARLGLEPP